MTDWRRAAFAALDRPGGRWALRWGAQTVLSAATRQRVTIRYDGQWVHRYPGGVIVDVQLNSHTPARIAAATRRYFLRRYTPQPGDTVVDVGAGTGEEALIFSRMVGPAGRVVAVEAHPRTFACLERTIAENRLDNVTAVAAAASDTEGTLRISDSASHISNTVLGGGGLAVEGKPLDAILPALGVATVDFLKMNIEGAERLAIDGMHETVRRTRHVAIGCHDFTQDGAGQAANEHMRTLVPVRSFLEANGFDVVRPEDDPLPWVRDTLFGANPALTEP